MIAKFFIERPILANVIALLTIILGLVALIRLPVAQYPNIVPPTVQVTARYPGASAATVVRDVALPIEQKVNGVEGMIYMSSMSTSDGSYTLTVTFRIGTDADKAQILVQNRVTSAQPSLPQAVQVQGRADGKAVDLDPRNRGVEFPGRALRQPVPVELCDHQPRRRNRPRRRGRQRFGVRRRPVCHAPMAGSRKSCRRATWCPRTSSTPSTCKVGPRAPDNWASRRSQKGRSSNTPSMCRANSTMSPSSRTSSSRPTPRAAAASRGCATSPASSSVRNSIARPSSSTRSRRPGSPSSNSRRPTRSTSPSGSSAVCRRCSPPFRRR